MVWNPHKVKYHESSAKFLESRSIFNIIGEFENYFTTYTIFWWFRYWYTNTRSNSTCGRLYKVNSYLNFTINTLSAHENKFSHIRCLQHSKRLRPVSSFPYYESVLEHIVHLMKRTTEAKKRERPEFRLSI